jgi:hypothetical protein
VPAAWPAISPDGARYAYATPNGDGSKTDIHVVDVESGVDRIVLSSGRYQPLQFDSQVIYLIDARPTGLWEGAGLYSLDVADGSFQTLHVGGTGDHESWSLVSNGIAYGIDQNPNDPNPPGSGEAADEIARLDLSTGAETHILYEQGRIVNLWGQSPDARVLVRVAGSWMLFDSRGETTSVDGLPGGNGPSFMGGGQAWITAANVTQIYRLWPDGSVTLVGPLNIPPARSLGWEWSGTCH